MPIVFNDWMWFVDTRAGQRVCDFLVKNTILTSTNVTKYEHLMNIPIKIIK